MIIFCYLFNLATISQQFLFLPGLPSKSGDRSSPQKVTTVYERWHPKKFGLYFFGVARKRSLVFIAIGELHMGLAWDIPVILFSKKIAPNIS
jgi:hypothetical protein